MSPNRKLSRQACLLLFIVSQLYKLKSINYFKGEHAQSQFWSNLEITAVVTLYIRSRSSKYN